MREEGKRADAATLFLTAAVGMPAVVVEKMRAAPFWPNMERMAPTLAYDAALSADTEALLERVAHAQTPTRIFYGSESPAWLREGLETLARAMPSASTQSLAGQTHDIAPEVPAPALAAFFGAI
jgi:hypothetical protein